MRWRKAASPTRRANASARLAGSSAGQSRPVAPSRTTSCKASTRLATTGTPAAMASRALRPKPSFFAAGHHGDIKALDRTVDCRARQSTGKVRDGADAQLRGQGRQTGLLGSATHDHQPHWQALPVQPRHGMEQHIGPLDVRQASGKTQHHHMLPARHGAPAPCGDGLHGAHVQRVGDYHHAPTDPLCTPLRTKKCRWPRCEKRRQTGRTQCRASQRSAWSPPVNSVKPPHAPQRRACG